jgi:predicted GNAT family acetyltransferase
MEIFSLTDRNIEDEHICCAISDKKCRAGYQKKKEWLRREFKHGYSFQKLDVRGKVFIEYTPIESSWLPLVGENFMVINCFWVSGQFKGEGNGKQLLQKCLKSAKKMDGVVAVSSDKKRPFMSDPKFLKYRGFEIVDTAPPFFKLWGLKINPTATFPKFMDSARSGVCPDKKGITAYYSNSCPFTDYYTNQLLREYARKREIPLTVHHIKSREDGHKMPIPWIINSVFYQGKLVTLEMKAERQLEKLLN